jgi:poly(3-hydroxyalkanoate) synthetase
MNQSNTFSNNMRHTDYYKDAYDYSVDAFQRSVIFMDVMRKRGNIYFEHKKNNKPPVLMFDYDVIMDGRNLDRPVNFSLVQISDRRHNELEPLDGSDKRHNPVEEAPYDPLKRPIIIVDPRAGHGPGIGGSKRDSEIGMALNEGHPVYFFVFSANPVQGQTFTDVHNAQIRFIEAIIKRHPDAEKPAIIGNCQGGWASALIGADRPDITGPMIFNGSPLSYWAGVDGKNPMRYRGGLCGGVWLTLLWNDLGNVIFDSANLVAGFEDLNPANTLWKKQYNLYANIDTEEQRYLDFERWWNGYFMMTREEIHYIVDNLFVGNKLEEGQLEIDDRRIDLKNLKDPVLVFASNGDNITPPQQALNWIVKVWKSVDGIKRRQQVVVYLVHETIGHLGIFVSGKVSRKEHKEIIASIDLIEYLSPGLYEMVIEETPAEDRNKVRFETRDMDDILALDDGLTDEEKVLLGRIRKTLGL